jgi:hypothetical protein
MRPDSLDGNGSEHEGLSLTSFSDPSSESPVRLHRTRLTWQFNDPSFLRHNAGIATPFDFSYKPGLENGKAVGFLYLASIRALSGQNSSGQVKISFCHYPGGIKGETQPDMTTALILNHRQLRDKVFSDFTNVFGDLASSINQTDERPLEFVLTFWGVSSDDFCKRVVTIVHTLMVRCGYLNEVSKSIAGQFTLAEETLVKATSKSPWLLREHYEKERLGFKISASPHIRPYYFGHRHQRDMNW